MITILDGDDALAQVNDVEVEFSSDLLTMNVMVCNMILYQLPQP
jgi:hypothetical protein